MKRLALVILSLVLVALAVGCGEDKNAGVESIGMSADRLLGLIRQSSDELQEVTTFEAEVEMSGKVGSQRSRIRFRERVRYPDALYVESKDGGKAIEAVMIGDKTFVKEDGEWTRVDLGFSLKTVLENAKKMSPDPDAITKVSEIGKETIDGVETTGIRYDIDYDKAVENAKGMFGGQLPEWMSDAEELNDVEATGEVWIGNNDNYPRRYLAKMKGTFAGKSYESEMVMELFGFNEPVDIPTLEELEGEQ